MRILIFRSGAFGDSIVITPVIRYLHSQGHELYVQTSKRGMEVFKNNPHIARLIQHKEDTPIDQLSDNIEEVRRKMKCDKVLDFSESIEVALSQHPGSPNYKLSKPERLARFNRNFYEYSFEHAGEQWKTQSEWGITYEKLLPELFFDESEIRSAKTDLRDGFNILVGMSGSGSNKAWPWMEDFCLKVVNKNSDVYIITVGDDRCRLIEPKHKRIKNLSGSVSMRHSMALTSVVDLVIAPDTGIIHASGCYDTPKICLLGHTTREMITKHFKNDYSIEADPELAPCSPCSYLIYDKNIQCPTDEEAAGASLCMSKGISPDRVYERFQEVYAKHKKRS